MKELMCLRNILMPAQYPPYIIFFVTARCNMACAHCFIKRDTDSRDDELGIEEIDRISGSMPHLFFVRITGGEPFLRDDLGRIVESFYRNSHIRRIGINTNGIITEKTIDSVREIITSLEGLDLEVGISVDNLYEKHDRIRSAPGAFAKAMKTYEGLAGLRQKNNNLKLGFLITMMKDNERDLEKIFEYLRSKNPDNIGLNIIRGDPRDVSQLDVDIERYAEFRDILNRYNSGNILKNRSFMERMRMNKTVMSQDAIIETVRKNAGRIRCLAADKIAVLYPNGDVAACELLPDVIANARDVDYDFKKLWSLRNRKEISDKIKKTGCFCTHECFITAGLIFNPANLLRIFMKTL